MKKIILTILLVGSAILSVVSQDTYFPYPKVPENIENFEQRANYAVFHFWDYCNFGNAFSSRQKFNGAFKDYLQFLPHASADTVKISINSLLKNVKKRPKDLLALGQMAEASLYSDSALYWSDEVYGMFADAVASNKKVPAADRAHFKRHASIMNNSQVGMPFPKMKMVKSDGSEFAMDSLKSKVTFVILHDPEDSELAIQRVRLAANISMTKLVDSRVVTIVYLNPAEPDDKWNSFTETLPKNWIAVSAPDAVDMMDYRVTPSAYQLNSKHEIKAKNIRPIDVMAWAENVVLSTR